MLDFIKGEVSNSKDEIERLKSAIRARAGFRKVLAKDARDLKYITRATNRANLSTKMLNDVRNDTKMNIHGNEQVIQQLKGKMLELNEKHSKLEELLELTLKEDK